MLLSQATAGESPAEHIPEHGGYSHCLPWLIPKGPKSARNRVRGETSRCKEKQEKETSEVKNQTRMHTGNTVFPLLYVAAYMYLCIYSCMCRPVYVLWGEGGAVECICVYGDAYV